MAGDMLPKLVVEFASLRNELEEALDELESLKKAEPKTGSGAAGPSGPARTASNFLDAVNAAFGG